MRFLRERSVLPQWRIVTRAIVRSRTRRDRISLPHAVDALELLTASAQGSVLATCVGRARRAEVGPGRRARGRRRSAVPASHEEHRVRRSASSAACEALAVAFGVLTVGRGTRPESAARVDRIRFGPGGRTAPPGVLPEAQPSGTAGLPRAALAAQDEVAGQPPARAVLALLAIGEGARSTRGWR